MAFKDHKLNVGQDLPTKINFPDGTTIESVKIKVLSIDENDICHTEFIEMESSQREMIHKYTLKRQVDIARKNKESKHRNWHTQV